MADTRLDKLSPLTELTLESVNEMIRQLNTRFDRLAPSLAAQPAHKTNTLSPRSGLVNDFPLGRGSVFNLIVPQACVITGFAGGFEGRLVCVSNLSQVTMTLAYRSASSIASNRIATRTGADITLAAGAAGLLLYDGTLQVWLYVGTLP